MKKYLLLVVISMFTFANGNEKLPINSTGKVVSAKEGQVVDLPTESKGGVKTGKVSASGKYVNPKYESIEEGLKDIKDKNSNKNIKTDNLDEKSLLQKRESIQKSISERDLTLSDKKLLSGKQEAIKRVSTSFEYFNDSIYEIFSTPDFITTVKFNPDEQILNVAGGDVENWNIEQTQGGEGNSTYLYIMPIDTDLVTNLSVITTKRAYIFTLYSTNYTYNPLVRFTYPLENVSLGYKGLGVGTVIKGTTLNNVARPITNDSLVDSKIKVNTLDDIDFDYAVSKGDSSITPTKVYSDKRQTVIEFKDDIVEVPVLFVKGTSGEYEVVNYKHSGNRILVDRKIEKGALKLGKETVYIEHK